MHHITTFWSIGDLRYNGDPEKPLSPCDIPYSYKVIVQPVTVICGDADGNRPTVLPVMSRCSIHNYA